MTSVVEENILEFERKYTQHCVARWNEFIKIDAFEVASEEQKFSTNVNTSSQLMDEASWLNYFGLNPKCYVLFHYGQIYAEWENIHYMLNDSGSLHSSFITVRNIELAIQKNFSAKERQAIFLWMQNDSVTNISRDAIEKMLENVNQDQTPFKQISDADYIAFKKEKMLKKEKK